MIDDRLSWLAQPQECVDLDRDNPWARDLVHAFEGGLGRQMDFVNGKAVTIAGTKQPACTDAIGTGLGTTLGLGAADVITTPITHHSAKRSWHLRAFTNGAGNSQLGRYLDKGVNSERLNFTTVGGNPIYFGRTTGGGSDAGYTFGNLAAVQGRVCDIFISWDTSAAPSAWAQPLIYIDETLQSLTVSGATSGTLDSNASPICWGNRGTDVARNGDIALIFGRIWDRIVPVDEYFEMRRAAWRLFAPRTSSIFSVGATPVSFGGTVATQNGTVGAAFSVDLASYFTGSLTPFTFSTQAGTLPAGLTRTGSVISGTPTGAETQAGIVIRATDTGSNTADTNSFSIAISASSSGLVSKIIQQSGA